MPTTKTRKSISLSNDEIERIDRIEQDGLRREALLRYAGHVDSETALLHALLIRGLEAIEREADEDAYALLAETQDDEDLAFNQAMRTRRRDAA